MKAIVLRTVTLIIAILKTFVNCQWDLTDYGVITDLQHRYKFNWGTYKPNLYFAMKNRRNMSDVFGVMWYGPSSTDFSEQGDIGQRLRHNCVNDDKVNYHWERHNGADFGSEIIEDKLNNLKLNIKFVKKEYNSTSQSWDAYIKGEFQNKKNTSPNNKPISILLYFSMENFNLQDRSYFKFNENSTSILNHKNLIFEATENEKEKYNYRVKFGEYTKVVDYSFQKYRKRYTDTWRVKNFVSEDLNEYESENLKNNKNSWNYEKLKIKKRINQPNIVVVQLIFDKDFEILINFSSTTRFANILPYEEDYSNPLEETKNLFELKEREFDKKFDKIYWNQFSDKYNNLKGINLYQLKKMCVQAMSNLLGGIGYFYGAIKINVDELKPGEKYPVGFRYAIEPHGIFTGTPSRSFFSRGFLWDEGFHNIIFSQWDMDLSIDIMNSWLSTMSATGWIAREQIRGAEAESQVPEKFILQDKLVANPPTFIFAIGNILEYYKYNSEEKNLQNVKSFLKKCYDKMGASYEWFMMHQKSSDGSYQWYGRTSDHNLASGLDDFPRAMIPNIYEKHLDLQVWMIEMTKFLRNMSELFQYESVDYFDKRYTRLVDELEKKFLDKSTGLLSDYLGPQFKLLEIDEFKRPVPPYFWRGDGRCGAEAPSPLGSPSECNPYSVEPCCSQFGWCGNSNQHCNCPQCSKSKKLEERKEFRDKKKIHNPHIGYINLYPLAFGLLKIDDPAFRLILHYLRSDDELYSDYGIRSLSKSDLLYHTGEDYWRGNVWININYLVLRGLYKFYADDAEAKNIYLTIREALIKNVFREWQKENTFYEQYSDINGKGVKARNFN